MKEGTSTDISFYFIKFSDDQIQCCICGKCFQSGQDGTNEDHLKSCHSDIYLKIKRNTFNLKEETKGSKLQCPQCNKLFSNKQPLTRHIQTKHKGIIYTCKYCDYDNVRKDEVKTHIKVVHEGIMVSCGHCDKQYRRQTYLRQHIQTEHEKINYPCRECDFQAITKKN